METDALTINLFDCSNTMRELNGTIVSPAGTIEPLINVDTTDPLCICTVIYSSVVDVFATSNDNIIEDTFCGAVYIAIPGVDIGFSTSLNVLIGIRAVAIIYILC